MAEYNFWLDLHLSESKYKRAFFINLEQQKNQSLNEYVQEFVERNHLRDAHKQISDLPTWLTSPRHGFLPYPELPDAVREIADPPIGLFYQGDISLLTTKIVAIVGSRKPSPAGLENSRHFAYYLAKSGLTLVSGMALGVDTSVHQSAVDAGGKTISILGQGLNSYYPKANRQLQQTLSTQGLLLSEYLPNQGVKAWQFPYRNRLISAISEGVLVVEAALKSGSLVTARCAAEQGRQVFAIPGDIQNPMVSGCHYLIREGAQLVSHPNEILDALFWTQSEQLALLKTPIQQKPITEIENKVLQALDRTPRHLDIIQARTECELTLVLDALFSLELKDMIISSIDGYLKPNQGDTC